MIYVPYLARAAVDPNWDKRVLLLHGDGTNGSQTIIDSSGSAHSISVTGTPAISTANPLFGSGSILFDGSTGYLSAGLSSDWELAGSDFTFDFSLRNFVAPGGNFETPIIAHWSSNSGEGLSWIITRDINNLLTFYYVQAGIANFGAKSTSGIVAGTSYTRYRICRSGSTLYFFIDGTLDNTASITGSIDYTPNTPLTIGGTNYSGNNYLNAEIDELRITVGYAESTASYTPETAAFPDG